VKKNQKYQCPCGYIYDPEFGDPENGIDGGLPFEDLPEQWVCPDCGADQEAFEPMD
jgi:rubredoxin